MPSHRVLRRSPSSAALLLALALALAAPAAPSRAVELTSSGDIKDFVILYSLGYYNHWFPGAGIFLFDDAVFSNMKGGEAVWSVAHGSVGEVGTKTAGELLALFTAKRLPAATPQVYLFSCQSGSTDRFHPQSLVAQLGVAMRSAQWKNLQVVGTGGCSITDAAVKRPNSERVVRPGKEDAILAIQDRLEAELRPQQDIDRYLDEFKSKNGRPASLAERTQYAYLYSQPTRSFFAVLLREADLQNLLYPAGTGYVTYP